MTFGKVGLPSNSPAAFMLSNPFNIAANGAPIQTNPLGPFTNFSSFSQSPSILNPLLNMATIRQQSEQFATPGIGQLMNSQENLNLLNALLKQSTSNAPNVQRISTLLTEQQAREAEAHRLQFLDFNSFHTNTLAGPSTLLPNSNITHQSNNILNSSINYTHNIPKLPPNNVFNMVENTLIDRSTNNAASTSKQSNQTDNQLGILPHQPYYPTHFMRGTVIQTATDTKKLVETLQKEDFQNLTDIATLAHQKSIQIGVVVSLKLVESTARYVDVEFKTEAMMNNDELEIATWTLNNVPIEYPFYEVKKGWSSYNPTKSLNLYGIECKQLMIGDSCLVLTDDQDSDETEPSNQRLSPIPETSSRSDSQVSSTSTERRTVSYFSTKDVEMDEHVII